ncbi:MAG: hypothetical protein WD740_00520 [Anaerolineales bacterium]
MHKLISEEKLQPGIALEDAAALHYIDDKMSKVIVSKRDARAFSVGIENGKVTETELLDNYLG